MGFGVSFQTRRFQPCQCMCLCLALAGLSQLPCHSLTQLLSQGATQSIFGLKPKIMSQPISDGISFSPPMEETASTHNIIVWIFFMHHFSDFRYRVSHTSRGFIMANQLSVIFAAVKFLCNHLWFDSFTPFNF